MSDTHRLRLKWSTVRPLDDREGKYPMAALELLRNEEDEYIIRSSLYFKEWDRPRIQEFILLRPLNLTLSWRWALELYQKAVDREPIYDRMLGDYRDVHVRMVDRMDNRHIEGSI